MLLDQLSLLTAIGFSTAALTVTLFVGWLGSSRDRYLLSWALGAAQLTAGVYMFGALSAHYSVLLHCLSFIALMTGFQTVHIAAFLYRGQTLNWVAFAPGIFFLIATIVSFATGYSGIGTMIGNAGVGTITAMTGYQYWAGRHLDAKWAMCATSFLYTMTAVTFLLCPIPLLLAGEYVVDISPSNWAEDINSFAVIVSLTGIGGMSLSLNQMRRARVHRDEAMTDSLTGLLNRRALFELASNGNLAPGTAVVMFDLDHFKSINDKLGHAGGDAVLQRFAGHLREATRSEDSCARLGGEEFCAVLPNLIGRSPAAVAERVRVNFSADQIAIGNGTSATVSAGVAIAGIEGEAFEAVLRRADDALYKAKSAGRNRVHAPGPKLVA